MVGGREVIIVDLLRIGHTCRKRSRYLFAAAVTAPRNVLRIVQGLPRYDAERQIFHPHCKLQEILGVERHDVYNVLTYIDMSEYLTLFH